MVLYYCYPTKVPEKVLLSTHRPLTATAVFFYLPTKSAYNRCDSFLAWSRMRVVMRKGRAALLPCRRGRFVGVSRVALFRAFSGRSCRGWCCRCGVAFVGLVWACFRPVARVVLRVVCAVAVLALFFAPFRRVRRGGYMRIPPKRKSRLQGDFCPSCDLPLFAVDFGKSKRKAASRNACRRFLKFL